MECRPTSHPPVLGPLCACALLAAGPAVAADDGAIGASSSGTVAIQVSVASGGALSRAVAMPGATPGGGEAMCLWLNTGTGSYRLKSEGGQAPAHRLRWTDDGESFLLRDRGESELMVADRRPGCPDGPARLTAERTSALATGQVMTLLVVPE